MKQKTTPFGLLAATTLAAVAGHAATLPAGFTEEIYSGTPAPFNAPTAMEFAPDGRLFICEQGGPVRVVKNGVRLAAPFVTLTVNNTGERGVVGLTFDPAFNSNHYVYIYYTATTPTIHNRISRFTANGNVAAPGSEKVLFDLPDSGANNHNGGALHFGADGKLYVGVGENGVTANAQSLITPLGKLLRLNPDGSIPADNPFHDGAGPNADAIWALGLRNPFTFAVQPGTGRLFINDVGLHAFEEINLGRAGANYGWATTEGPIDPPDPRFDAPLFAYPHNGGAPNTFGCAITGGTFYNPATAQFPAGYAGKYFFQDYCGGWIRVLDPTDNSVTGFAQNLPRLVDLDVGPDGALYLLTRVDGHAFLDGRVRRIRYYGTDAKAPNISFTSPTNGATVSDLNAVSGKTLDNAGGSNLSAVTLRIFRRSDSKYWDGTAWIAANTFLPATLSGNSGLATWTRNAGMPAGAALTAGAYTLQARATDLAGNLGIAIANITVTPASTPSE